MSGTTANKGITKFAYSLLQGVFVQMVVASFSLPVLAFWQMDISLLSLAGNMLFSPVLMVVLLLCSLIFFAELAALPHGIFDIVLKKLLTLWLWFMACADNRFMISYSTSPWQLLLLIPAVALFAYLYQRRNLNLVYCTLGFAAIHCLQIIILLLCRP